MYTLSKFEFEASRSSAQPLGLLSHPVTSQMVIFSELPQELIGLIVHKVHGHEDARTDLRNLSCTCKALRQLLELLLHRDIRFFFSADRDRLRIVSVLRTIMTRPQLATLVHLLQLRH